MSVQSRRGVLKGAAASALVVLGHGSLPAPAAALEPIRRTGRAPLRLSLAAYSFRQWLTGPRRSMSLEDFIDRGAEYGLDAVELTSYYFPSPITREYLNKLKRRAFLLGLDISGTAVGNTFTHPPGPERDREIAHVKQWVDHAADFGAPTIRIFAGNVPEGSTEEQARKHTLECLETALEHAERRGVFLALENHGGIVSTADQLLAIVKAVDSDWFGVNLDTGNFHGEDPYVEMAAVAPYAVNVQVKTEIQPQGQPKREADLAREVEILREAGYRGYVVLEYEAAESAETAVPRHLQRLRSLLG